MFNQQFYHSLVKKYVSLFGTLFNDTYIIRYDSLGNKIAEIKVPISYAPKNKVFARVLGDPNLDKQVAVLLPRMSFEIASPGFQYDPSRKLSSINRRVAKDPNNAGKVLAQYSPVPYNIFFILHIYVNSVEDGLKIVEQIVPNFTPDFTSTVHLIPEIGETRDIPLELTSGPIMTDIYDGSFKNRRMIHWELNFTMRGFFYGPVKHKPIIKFANVTTSAAYGSYNDPVDPLFAEPVIRYKTQPGLLANGSPTSNASLTVAANTIFIDSNFGFINTIYDIPLAR